MARMHPSKEIGSRQPVLPRKKCGLLIALLIFTAIAAGVAVVALVLSRGSSAEELFSYQQLLMDTDVSLQFYCGSSDEAGRLKEVVFGEMERLERLLSYTDADSDVTTINRAAGKSSVQVSPETAALIQTALDYADLSEGAFDPTVAPLLEIWGFREEQRRHLPTPAEIEAAGALVDYRLVEIDAATGKVSLPQTGMGLDLGGIAKGYIIDRGLSLLSQAGVEHGLINAGGDIGILGPKLDGSAWRIGVKHPRRGGDLIAVISRSQKGAVVTSGDYERFFEEDGVRYHHILEPWTGYPASALFSVTVVAPTAVEADALSTALFVLGPQRGLALVERLPDVEAIMVTPQLELLISSGLQDSVEPAGEN